ncbi:MAG: F0F1 ATP synthase subunit B' [Hyphomicrobium sp.]|jgi:F-type H+-transporting ATPase subunit b|uniref:F0F1 ATP synthase subunit B family protein n=2 Tax=Hyphomicrobium TaxID=81 RepID=UPI0025C51FB4|nr:F0F1 ATP synthase subunit B' [Hyphomicrobium sp.]MBX9864499.1 F0F1 ATP synthase subunit B' [Hyphomicrobium sp.]
MITAMTVLVAEALDVGRDVAEALDEHKSGGLPQLHAPDFAPQLFWLAVTFVLLYWIMSKVALPRIGEVIEERRDRIQRDLAAAERLKGETDKALQTYEKALSDARGSASAIARKTRDELGAEVDKERKAVEDQLAKKLADAEASIAATKTKALASVKDIAGDTVVEIVNALTNINVTKDEAVRAIPSGSDK